MSIHKTPTFFLALAGLLLTVDGVAQENNASSNSGRARYEEPKFRMGLHLLPSIAWLDARDGSTVSDGSIGRFGFGQGVEAGLRNMMHVPGHRDPVEEAVGGFGT